MKRLLLIALLTLISAQHALAQSSPEDKKNTLPFKIASWGEWKNKDFFIQSPEKPSKEMVRLEILDMGYSRDYFVENGATFNLYHETGDEEEPYAVALKISIPPSVKMPLVMLTQDKDGKPNYTIFDIDPSIFPYGTYQIVNTSKLNLRTFFGENQQDLNAGARHLIQPSDAERDKAIHCKIAVIKDTQLKVVWENMLFNRSTKRMLMFIYIDKDEVDRPAVKFKNLVDFKINKKANE